MPDIKFRYFGTDAEIEAIWPLVLPFINKARKKLPRLASNDDLYACLLESRRYILAATLCDGEVVGAVILSRITDAVFGESGLQVVLVAAHGIPNFLEQLRCECDRIAEIQELDFVRFTAARKGWQKLLKMEAGGEYKEGSFCLEKRYGWRRRCP